jgi:hypothetical protein
MRPGERYARDGYEVHEGIPAADAGKLLAVIDGFIAAQAAEVGVDRATYLDVFCRWSTPNPHVQGLVDKLSPAVHGAAEDAIGTALQAGRATLFRKGGAAHLGTHGHQDAGYWGHGTSSTYLATTWLTFDSTEDETGALQVVPGSHQGEVGAPVDFLAPTFLDPATSWGASSRTLQIPAGGAVTFHPTLWHASRPVSPAATRTALAIRWLPAVGDPPRSKQQGGAVGEAFGMYTSGEQLHAALVKLARQPVPPGAVGVRWALDNRLDEALPQPAEARAALHRLYLLLSVGPWHHGADQRGMVWDAVRDAVVLPAQALGNPEPAKASEA